MSDNDQNSLEIGSEAPGANKAPAANKKADLFGLFKRKSAEQKAPQQEESLEKTAAEREESSGLEPPAVKPQEQEKPKTLAFGARIRRALSRTGSGLGTLLLGSKTIDDDLLDELETLLLMADVGVDVTSEIIETLTAKVRRSELKDAAALQLALQKILQELLQPCEAPLVCAPTQTANGKRPYVLLVVGVNGVGKTTTIGKLAKRMQNEGRSVMLAAGDTFRAAAVEQLQVWGERNQVPVVAQHTGADSASVIFDAIQSAQAKGVDVIIADTAGRLHTKSNLMEELKKVQRVIGKLDDSAPHEVLLVLDAGTGQNALSQMKQFHEAVVVTGLALTKLDGTAKGGIAFALARKFAVPIRFIGVGEGADDLQPFNAEQFVSALIRPDQELS